MNQTTNIFSSNNDAINKLTNYKGINILAWGLLSSGVAVYFNSFIPCLVGLICVLITHSFLNSRIDFFRNQNMHLFQNQNFQKSMHEYDYDLQPSGSQTNSFEKNKFGTLIYPPKNAESIILSEKVKNSINSSICKIKNKDFLYETWNYKSVDPDANKCILNFFGLPGTGKTLSAKELSRTLNKPLYIVDYAQTESKMVGETEKNISEIFAYAKKHNAIILLDEADTLASKRVEDSSSSSRHINAARNVFMQELDKFDGVVILTTNLFSTFDPALLRRISQHIEFELPNEEMRIEIISKHIPKEVKLNEDVDFKKLSKITSGFSGGDIKNFTREALLMAIMDADSKNDITNAELTQSHLENEISKIKKSKDSYNKVDESKVIGIKR